MTIARRQRKLETDCGLSLTIILFQSSWPSIILPAVVPAAPAAIVRGSSEITNFRRPSAAEAASELSSPCLSIARSYVAGCEADRPSGKSVVCRGRKRSARTATSRQCALAVAPNGTIYVIELAQRRDRRRSAGTFVLRVDASASRGEATCQRKAGTNEFAGTGRGSGRNACRHG